MSLLDSKNGGATSIGNYKGVMLCNRPFGGVSGATKANSVPVKAFGCGVVSEEIGAHVSLASKEKVCKICCFVCVWFDCYLFFYAKLLC
jgi:hypothetical protein